MNKSIFLPGTSRKFAGQMTQTDTTHNFDLKIDNLDQKRAEFTSNERVKHDNVSTGIAFQRPINHKVGLLY